MKITFHICLLFAVIFLSNCSKSESYSSEQRAAIDSAIAWLNLLDEGKYGKSWQIASPSFKEDVAQRQWQIGLRHMRAPLGRVQSREVNSCRFSNYNSNLGKHLNATIKFQTVLEDQSTVTEFLTLQIDDETWRVSTYYLDH